MERHLQRLRTIWKLIEHTAHKWESSNIAWMSAALAYYTLFSLAPTFIIIVSIGSTFLDEELITGQIVYYLEDLIGHNPAMLIQQMVQSGRDMADFSLSNIIGVLIILYAATNVFFHLKHTLNEIWEVSGSDRHWVISMLLNRLFSVLMVLAVGIILLGLMLTDVFLATFDQLLAEFLPVFERAIVWKIINFGVSFLITGFIFAAIYKYIPDARVKWRDVWLGGIIVALLFTIGKFLIALYLSSSQIISLFGATSSFVAILVWVYFSAQILLLGAAFTHYYAYEFGSHRGERYSEKALIEAVTKLED
jgi:membrane protein